MDSQTDIITIEQPNARQIRDGYENIIVRSDNVDIVGMETHELAGEILVKLRKAKVIKKPVLTGLVAAISVGVVKGQAVLDLDYVEDSAAEVDMNIVRTDDRRYIEIQGTAETEPFSRERLDAMLALADVGIDQLLSIQRDVIGPDLDDLLIRG